MMRWLRRRQATPQADKELADAQAEQAQVVKMDEHTRQLERRIKQHLATNNFARRIRAEILATERGRHA